MELHTVGLAAGYSQADVTELARALTGWSLGRPDDPAEPQGFMFRPFAHEPGVRTIMGRRYPDDGEGQAQAVLAELAASPFTARHLAGEIARHFVRDDPPPTLVEQLSRRWMATGGNLAAVAEALIAAPESWDPTPGKFKTPYEFLASSWRAAGVVPDTVGPVNHALTTLGQRPFAAPSPKGWPDSEAAWCDPDGIVKRMAWSEDFAQHAVGERDPVQLADMALGGRLGGAARLAVGRAETRAEGLSILLMSPEFQRR